MKKALFTASLVSLLSALPCIADFWIAPSPIIVASESGDYAYHIVPVEKEGGSFEATAHFLRTAKDNSISRDKGYKLVSFPLKILVPGNGYMITFDDWGQAGRDHALVIYLNGRLKWDFSLDELHSMTGDRLSAHVTHTESSTWWRKTAEISVEVPWDDPDSVSKRKDFDRARLHIEYPDGLRLSVELSSGKASAKKNVQKSARDQAEATPAIK